MQLQYEDKFETPTRDGKQQNCLCLRISLHMFQFAWAFSFSLVTRLFVGFALLRRTPTRFSFGFTRLVFLCPSSSWRSPVSFLGSSFSFSLLQSH